MSTQTTLFSEGTRASATISECGRYRYDLTRTWGESEHPSRKALFVMLNPSWADGFRPDPTMTRCVNFAKSWGFDGLAIVNLYGLRSSNPKTLWEVPDPIGPGNGKSLIEWTSEAGLIVCAWGAEPKAKRRSDDVLRFLHEFRLRPHAIGLTQAGSPRHPLYVPASATPFPLEVTSQ